MIQALGKSSPSQKEELIRWLTTKDYNRGEKIKGVTSIFNTLNIKKITEKRIKDFYEISLANLERLNKPDDRKAELYNFASYLKTRIK